MVNSLAADYKGVHFEVHSKVKAIIRGLAGDQVQFFVTHTKDFDHAKDLILFRQRPGYFWVIYLGLNLFRLHLFRLTRRGVLDISGSRRPRQCLNQMLSAHVKMEKVPGVWKKLTMRTFCTCRVNGFSQHSSLVIKTTVCGCRKLNGREMTHQTDQRCRNEVLGAHVDNV